MSFKFKKASCVVVGAFNVYVFQPSFFAHTEIVKSGTKTAIVGDFSHPGFRASFEGYSNAWIIRPDRLHIETTDSTADCGDPAAKVLETLPWTPISAIGFNFEFSASIDDPQANSVNQLMPKTGDAHRVSQRTIHVGIEEEQQVFNISIVVTNDSIEFTANVHAEVKKLAGAESTRTQISESAAGFARRFRECRDKSIALGREVFGLEIENANNDN